MVLFLHLDILAMSYNGCVQFLFQNWKLKLSFIYILSNHELNGIIQNHHQSIRLRRVWDSLSDSINQNIEYTNQGRVLKTTQYKNTPTVQHLFRCQSHDSI